MIQQKNLRKTSKTEQQRNRSDLLESKKSKWEITNFTIQAPTDSVLTSATVSD